MNKKIALLVVLSAILCFPLDALAYLDAGTGSMLIQGIIGAIAAAIVVIKLYWHRLLTFFGIRKKQETNEESKQ